MSRSYISALLPTTILLALLLLSACALQPINGSRSNGKFDHAVYTDLARQKAASGDYHAALTYWKLAQTVHPHDPEATHQIRTLRAFINRRTAYMASEADFFMQQGMTSRARTLYLKILSLNPHDKQVLSQLRALNRQQVTVVQQARTERLQARPAAQKEAEAYTQNDYYFELARAAIDAADWSKAVTEINRFMRGSTRHNRDALKILSTAEYNLAQDFEKQGNYEQAITHADRAVKAAQKRKDLQSYRNKLASRAANHYYNEGVKVSRQDLAQAIDWWNRAVALDPSHSRARLRLKRARTMQKTLKKIQ